MQARRFTTWLRQLNGLTQRQRAHLMHALRPAVGLDRVCEVIDCATRAAPPCPACQGKHSFQNVNGYHRRLRQWLTRFNGVASRYLPNYLGWRWALDGERIASPERFLEAAMGLFHT